MDQEYPELKTRVQSTFIDAVLMIVLMLLAGWVFDRAGLGENENSGLMKAIVFVSIWGIYEPLSTALGATVGNHLMKIRVKQVNAIGRRLNIFQALIRFIFKFFLGWLSFLTIHFNPQRRAIHDIVAGSVMLEK